MKEKNLNAAQKILKDYNQLAGKLVATIMESDRLAEEVISIKSQMQKLLKTAQNLPKEEMEAANANLNAAIEEKEDAALVELANEAKSSDTLDFKEEMKTDVKEEANNG